MIFNLFGFILCGCNRECNKLESYNINKQNNDNTENKQNNKNILNNDNINNYKELEFNIEPPKLPEEPESVRLKNWVCPEHWNIIYSSFANST